MSSTLSRKRRGSPPRSLLIRLLTLLVVGSALVFAAPQAGASPAADPADKIKPKLSAQLDAKGEASFWIRFEQADLSAASQVKDWTKRGQAVYDTLKAAADSRQKDTLSLLKSEGASYQSFWATNAIRVEAGDTELATKI